MTHFLQSLRPLVVDLASTIVFVALYAVTGSVVLSVAAGMALGIGQIVRERAKGKPIDAMQWMSLALVIILGGATLLTRDPRFVMIKPGIAKFAIGFVMLRRGWMIRYLPAVVRENISEAVTVGFGHAWAVLMFALGFANLAVTYFAGFTAAVWFVSIAPLAATLLLFAVQYTVFRIMIRQRTRSGLARVAAE